MRLLVVEDNEELAQLLAQRLQAAGYETDVLTTAAEAQTAVTTTRYAAMVLDLGLPDADGLSVLRELRRRKDPARQETFLQLHKQCSCLALSSTVADDVIGIPLERYVRMRFRHPPVEHILQKQVRQQWTYYAPLWCSPLSQKIEAIEGIVPARHSLVGRRAAHEPEVVDSLPTPTFTVKDRPRISFSTNNYLGIATSPRTKAAATRGIKAYGVGNSDSRLLGGNLALYGELERKIARSNGKSHAILFATGYLTNLG